MRLPSLPGSRAQGLRSAVPVLEVAYPTLEAQSRTRRTTPVPPPAPRRQEPDETLEAQPEESVEAQLEEPPEEPPEAQPVESIDAQLEPEPEESLDAQLDADLDEPEEQFGRAPEDIVAEYLRTARAQYVESDLHAPLRSILIGGSVAWSRVRIVLLVLVFIAYNAGLGYMAWRAWGAIGAGDDRLLVPLVIGIGAVLGWIAADVEHAYRSRSRFYN